MKSDETCGFDLITKVLFSLAFSHFHMASRLGVPTRLLLSEITHVGVPNAIQPMQMSAMTPNSTK